MTRIFTTLTLALLLSSCDSEESSDNIQSKQQAKLILEATAQVGMPAIKNFRERKLMKDILEMRDQEGLVTYTYLWSDFQGKWVFFCASIGYGIPYSVQFTNPERVEHTNSGHITLPQADPNGLFSPAAADGTWVMCKDPNSDKALPVLVEPRAIVSPFKLESPTEVEDIQKPNIPTTHNK
jgi:hypothetical protein